MRLRNPILLFLCKFVLLYILLVLPWQGWDRIYGGYFRVLGRAVFASDRGQRELTFETMGEGNPHPFYTRIVIVNRRMIHADGSAPVRNLDLDAQSFGWKPTALFIALIAATPIPWRRRARSLFWGLLCTQLFFLLFLGFCIWNESTEVSLVILTPFWKHLADGVRDMLALHYDMVMPVMVWILVTFRREDRLGIGKIIFGPAAGGNSKPADASRK